MLVSRGIPWLTYIGGKMDDFGGRLFDILCNDEIGKELNSSKPFISKLSKLNVRGFITGQK